MLNMTMETKLEQEVTALEGKLQESFLFLSLFLSITLSLSLSLGFPRLKDDENGWNESSLQLYRPGNQVQYAKISNFYLHADGMD